MASTRTSLFLSLSILIGLLSIAAQGRPGRPFHPCNTLIIFSTATTSSFPIDRNPNFDSQNPFLQSSYSSERSVTFLFTEVRRVGPSRLMIPSEPSNLIDRDEIEQEKLPFPFGGLYSSSSVGASFLDRTNDILNVVGSLLFGVACGALTSLILYMIWSLFAPNHFEFLDSEDESETDDDVDSSPKKMGYVSIPAKGDLDLDLIPVPVAKEVC